MTATNSMSEAAPPDSSIATANDNPKLNINEAKQFLGVLGKHHNVVAIKNRKVDAKSKIRSTSGATGKWGKPLRDFITQSHEIKENVYYSINEPALASPNGKLDTADIAALRAAYVDLDPPKGVPFAEGRALLEKTVNDLLDPLSDLPSPTAIVDSGGGFQCLWLLSKCVPNTDDARAEYEGVNRALSTKLGGDLAVHDAARVLRLPGTVNRPDAAKVAKGRVVAQARVVHLDASVRYDLDDLKARVGWLAPSASDADRAVSDAAIHENMERLKANIALDCAGLDELPAPTREKLDRALSESKGFRALWERGAEYVEETKRARGDSDPDVSGSVLRMMLANAARDIDFDLNELAAIMSAWEHSGLEKYAGDDWRIRREIAKVFTKASAKRKQSDGTEFNAVEDDAVKGEPPTKTPLRYDDQLVTEWKPSDYLVKGIIPCEGVGVAYGPSQSLKSFVTLDLKSHLVRGREWFGRRVKQTGAVYWYGEGEHGIAKRMKGWSIENDTNGGRLGLFNANVDLLHTTPKKLLAYFANIKRCYESDTGQRLGMLTFDTLVKAGPGMDELSPGDVTTVLRNAEHVAKELALFVLLVSHTGKDESRGIHGSVRFLTNVDVVLKFEDGLFTVEKSKDDVIGTRYEFERKVVTLGKDADGDDVTTLVIKHRRSTPASAATAKIAKLKGNVADLFDQIKSLCAGKGAPVKIGDARTALNEARLRQDADALPMSPDASSSYKRRLLNLGLIVLHGDCVAPKGMAFGEELTAIDELPFEAVCEG
jgi:hypothetical protein